MEAETASVLSQANDDFHSFEGGRFLGCHGYDYCLRERDTVVLVCSRTKVL
jgi:hypothetical protein